MFEVIHNEIILTSESKVAKLIVENGELFGKLKNTQISSLLNLTPETLSRTLTKLKKERAVSFDENNKITNYDEELLKNIY